MSIREPTRGGGVMPTEAGAKRILHEAAYQKPSSIRITNCSWHGSLANWRRMKQTAANPRREWWIALLLGFGTCALYWPVGQYDFLNFDDSAYVTANPHVFRGISGRGLAWAFTNIEAANWHPVTWVSHMLDCQLFGFRPGLHHLTSVLIHAANAALLFGCLRYATGAMFRSALVAALFAWHPLHVESVAWIAERKDVLSTFFGLLALGFYIRYTK